MHFVRINRPYFYQRHQSRYRKSQTKSRQKLLILTPGKLHHHSAFSQFGRGLLSQKEIKNFVEDAPINGPFVQQRDRGTFLAPTRPWIDMLQSELVRLALEEALRNPVGPVATCWVLDISGRGIVLVKHV